MCTEQNMCIIERRADNDRHRNYNQCDRLVLVLILIVLVLVITFGSLLVPRFVIYSLSRF